MIYQVIINPFFRCRYLVTTLMPTDLHRVIYSQSLPEPHIGYIMYQILRGLKYMHSAKVIHRDLKPSNIAIDGGSFTPY